MGGPPFPLGKKTLSLIVPLRPMRRGFGSEEEGGEKKGKPRRGEKREVCLLAEKVLQRGELGLAKFKNETTGTAMSYRTISGRSMAASFPFYVSRKIARAKGVGK